MSLHIEFCLDEIDCEIEAAVDSTLDEIDRQSHQRHAAGMRAIIAFARMRSAAQQKVSDTAEDDLTMVKGIGPAEQKILNGAGVRTFAAIADWRIDDIKALAQHGISLERIACENWIEQAALLASGATTHYAAQSSKIESCVVSPEATAEQGSCVTDTDAGAEVASTGSHVMSEESGVEAPASSIETYEPAKVSSLNDVIPAREVAEQTAPSAVVIPFEDHVNQQRAGEPKVHRHNALTAAAVSLLLIIGFIGELRFGAIETIVISSLNLSTK